ncbi:hypothetical protein [Serratia sp. 201]|uniref:hypothetical protein n=1 Tax=Serratia sp. 201 TaxID=3096764 RepID=UPI00300967F8
MMDNKLSELSKPVAYDYQIADAYIADGHNENGKWVYWNNKLSRYCPPDWMVEEGKVTELKPLYSQEYVSALLAELEASKQYAKERDAENEGLALTVGRLRAELEAKTLEGRCIEQERGLFRVERTAHQQHAQELEKRIAELSRLLAHNIERAEKAEKRLVYSKDAIATWERKAISNFDECATMSQRIIELEAIRSDASQVFKEIGNELGCNPDNESIMMAIDKLKERLATPVRLLGEMLVHDWEHRVERQAAFEHRKIAWDARLAEDKKAILAAGFTFTVEGDE